VTREPDVETLNPEQRAAVSHLDGPLLVVAGAGSGKTRVLTHRIAHLIGEHNVHPNALLAITFTNKAAGEMAERVAGLVGGMVGERTIKGMWVTTFHKACVRILRREISRLGYRSGFTIYDQLDSQRLIAMISKELGVDDKRLSPRAIQTAISRAKDGLIDFDTYRSQAQTWPEVEIAEVYAAYQDRLFRANALDFDDLIVKAVEVLQLFDDVREHYQRRFRYVLIDEYQDTNRAQYHLVNLLTSSHHNLMVVGDPQQGVYSFRGATIQNIIDFEQDHPDATVVVLDRNYRSTQTILDAANSIIAESAVTTRAELWTDRGGGDLVVRYRAEDEHDEAAFVAAECARLVEEGVDLNDIAIFYRTNAQSRVLEEIFIRLGLRYRIIGGLRFYERKEIKDVLAYARLMLNPADDVSARRVVNTPRRGIGDRTVEQVDWFARREGLSFLEACRRAEEIQGLGARAVAAVTSFVDLLDGIRTALEHDLPVPELIELIWDRTGYLRELQADRTEEALFREENLRELRSVAQEVHERGEASGGFEGLAEFLESVTLVSDQDEIAGRIVAAGAAAVGGAAGAGVVSTAGDSEGTGEASTGAAGVVGEGGVRGASAAVGASGDGAATGDGNGGAASDGTATGDGVGGEPGNESGRSGGETEDGGGPGDKGGNDAGGAPDGGAGAAGVAGDEPAVTMMTLHTAKGLEYPVVFLVGLEDGVFPHARSLGDPDQIEEERRLCYVGFTRAQDRLYVSHADHRMLWGGASYNPASRFLDDVPDSLIEERRGGRLGGHAGGGIGWSADSDGGWGRARRGATGTGYGSGYAGGLGGAGAAGGAGGAGSSRASGGAGGSRGAGRSRGAGGAGGDLDAVEIAGSEFRIGDRVIHPKFGPGLVTELSGESDRAEATIEFDEEGTKHLVLAYAPLVRL